LNQKSSSTPDAIPWPKPDRSRTEPLENQSALEARQKCLKCNEQGRVYLYERKNPREAYAELQKGMLGDGESPYSQLVTGYFKYCLENFCAQRSTVDYADKFNFYVKDLRRWVLMPDYPLLKAALENLVRGAKEAKIWSEAIRFQKELIFFVILEGTQNDHFEEPIQGDCYGPLEERISKGVEELCNLAMVRPERNGK
jgi:hypothetical protein